MLVLLEHVLNGRAVEMKTSLSSPMLSVQTSHRMNTPNRCALTPDVEQPASVTQRGKNRANQCPAWLQWVCLFQVPRPQHRKNRLNFYWINECWPWLPLIRALNEMKSIKWNEINKMKYLYAVKWAKNSYVLIYFYCQCVNSL